MIIIDLSLFFFLNMTFINIKVSSLHGVLLFNVSENCEKWIILMKLKFLVNNLFFHESYRDTNSEIWQFFTVEEKSLYYINCKVYLYAYTGIRFWLQVYIVFICYGTPWIYFLLSERLKWLCHAFFSLLWFHLYLKGV